MENRKTNVLLAVAIGFVVTFLLAMILASETGERLKHGWSSLWCPKPPSLPMVLDESMRPRMMKDYDGEDDEWTCHDRVSVSTSIMSSVLLTLLTVAAAIGLWKSLANGSDRSSASLLKIDRFLI